MTQDDQLFMQCYMANSNFWWALNIHVVFHCLVQGYLKKLKSNGSNKIVFRKKDSEEKENSLIFLSRYNQYRIGIMPLLTGKQVYLRIYLN